MAKGYYSPALHIATVWGSEVNLVALASSIENRPPILTFATLSIEERP